MVKAQICKEFGWTPEELKQQEANEVFAMFEALALFSEYQTKLAETHARTQSRRR